MPSLSIVIPVHNVEKYLAKCLDSILVDNQFTGQVVCVNDGSTDGSLAILEQYAEKYSNIEIISQPNSGLSAARNAGLDKAAGEYVFFPDSDDWIIPGSIDKIMSQINGEEVVYFNAKVYSDEKQSFKSEIDIPNLRHLTGSAYFAAIYDKPRNMPCVCVWGGIFLRSFLIGNHLYNEPGIYHEDSLFTPQVLLLANNVSSLNEYVYVYRIRKGSITSHITMKHIVDSIHIIHTLKDFYEQRTNIAPIFYQYIEGSYKDVLREAYENDVHLNKVWTRHDSKMFVKVASTPYMIRVAKLTFISTQLAYLYSVNRLPAFIRRVINRFM